ncbi:MAG: hypothetical protein SCH39_08025 [Methanosarcinales archaeon]|nr:hypothetical protein [Methanosarcinales archaeon]
MEENYTLIIPVKPEKDQTRGYNAGPNAGEIEVHKKHLEENHGVFWSWGLSNYGLRDHLIQHLPELSKEFGKIEEINGKNVKINKVGYFYSTKDKSIKWEFEATSIMKKEVIKNNLSKYKDFIPIFRYQNHYENKNWIGDWMLITELKELEQPFKGKQVKNYYEFQNFIYFSRLKNQFVKFNTNYLVKGNAFVIKK